MSVAGLGVFSLLESRATTVATPAEAETGTLGGNAQMVSDVKASGGQFVNFGPMH